ncbi:hypothetical protein C0V72_07220 [Porphyrobacter sp. TH134]|uniref:hypothetical protein n=1 Tax=Porphyrobacter sp. TH134 TaxID=2067450 RepID=UPI000C79A286|nr:hypothetical protein [Porphyrobacter sp. TH134]PLK23837.1 hypothetical protein C0V72_07220 [Porphyrobacter sp. TH134]
MIKSIIGAAMGAQVAKKIPNVDNGTGAVLGSIVPMVLARLSLPTMLAIGAGGYLFKRYRDKQAAERTNPAQPAAGATKTAPAAKAADPAL